MKRLPNVLFLLPPAWVELGRETFGSPAYNVLFEGHDTFAPGDVDYFVGFKPAPGYLKSLPNLKAVFSLGAGVDGIVSDPEYPRAVPLTRFTHPALAHEVAQYVTLHLLMIHRRQRELDAAQRRHEWHQFMLPRATDQTRVGILGMGEIGGKIAERLALYGFQLSGWSRSRKTIAGVKSYAGESERDAFLAQCDILVCVLPLTAQTRDLLNSAFFAKLPRGAYVINVARGAVLVEEDLIAALDSGQLAGAVLDVFRTEPLPPDSPLWDHPKVVVTPHAAGITDPRMAMAYVRDCVARAEAGQPLPDLVDVARGY